MRTLTFILAAATAGLLAAGGAPAQDVDGSGNAKLGRAFAVDNCSECHQVVPRKLTFDHASPGPDFAAVAKVPGTTAKSLYVFLHTDHPSMPNLILSDQESANVIAYILSLKPPPSKQ